MKVSDEDIDGLWFDMGPGQSETPGEIVAELRALREVADAAKDLSDGMRSHNGGRWTVLRDALTKAGR